MTDLGRPIMEHRPPRRQRTFYAILTVVGMLTGGILLGLGAYRWAFAFSNYGPAVVWRWAGAWLTIGLILLIVGSIGAAWLLRWNWLSVTSFENGLKLQRGKRVRLIPWAEVQSILVSGVRYGMLGVFWGSRSSVRLSLAGNRKLRFTDTLVGLAQLISTAKQYVYPRLLTEFQRFLKDGQPVPFGPLLIEPEGVRKGARRLNWAEIASAQLRDGRITINTEGGGSALRVDVRKVPNAEICLQLIQHYSTGIRPRA